MDHARKIAHRDMNRSALHGLARRVAREPLVHFLVIGAAICVLSRVAGTSARWGATTVMVSRADIDLLIDQYTETWRRTPTPQELDGLIDAHVRQEILGREAVARGLDRDDAIIRQRLVQKMQFLALGAAPPPEPTDEQLAMFLAGRADWFRRQVRVSLAQVFLDPDRAAEGAPALLDRLNAAGVLDPTALGTPAGAEQPLPNELDDVSLAEVEERLGAAFAQRIVSTEPGRWTGPVESVRGLHLVLVRDLTPPALPGDAALRESLRHDWLEARRLAAEDELYRRVRRRYRVLIEPAAAPAKDR